MAESRIHSLASFLGLELDEGFRVDRVEPGHPAEVRLTRGEETILVRLLPASSEEKAYRKTRRFAVGYRKLPGTTVPLGPIDALVKWLAAGEASMPDAVLEALWPAESPSPATSGRDGPRKLQLLEHVEAPKRQGERPVRVVLVNLCEDPCEYGPGASEYLRAKLLSVPLLADRLEVTVLFMSGLDTDAFAERIAAREPDLVAFTCYSWNLDSSARTTRRLRTLGGERGGQPVVVWGGCSFAMLYERRDWFTYWDDVDAVAIGSGEQTIVDLATRVLTRGPGQGLGDAPIRGTILNVGGRLVEGERARVPATLEEVPSPYQLGVAFKVARPFVEMARGCRFECAFCSDARSSREGLWLPGTQARIAADIAAIAAWPVAREVDAGASTANVSEAHFADVCEGIRRGDPSGKLAYSLQMYPAIVRPSQRRALEGVRVKRIGIGVQSATPETWGPMRRKSTIEHIRRSADILRGVGPLYITVLLGLPGETYASFASMLDELLTIEDISLAVHRLLVLPGTQFHTHSERWELAFDPACFFRVQSTHTMTRADLARAMDHVRARAEQVGFTSSGERRIDWTNFDDQPLAFDGAPMPSARAL